MVIVNGIMATEVERLNKRITELEIERDNALKELNNFRDRVRKLIGYWHEETERYNNGQRDK